jgi:hypothetical protein
MLKFLKLVLAFFVGLVFADIISELLWNFFAGEGPTGSTVLAESFAARKLLTKFVSSIVVAILYEFAMRMIGTRK